MNYKRHLVSRLEHDLLLVKHQVFKFLQISKNDNMKSLMNILILALAANVAFSADVNNLGPENDVKFFQGSFESAKYKAGEEGKLFFVEFYADWCTPCKWMDKTTFRNENVVQILNNNYVALKMDIESQEGSLLKHKYSVRMLPTILIFNSEGDLVERVEKTLSSDSMVSLLSFHDNPKNRTVQNRKENSNPAIYADDRGPKLDNLYTQYQIAERFRTNYKLQIANYFNYNDAYEKVKELKETFIEPIVVLNTYMDNTTQYRVLMGEFKTIEEAESFRKILKNDFEIDSIIY